MIVLKYQFNCLWTTLPEFGPVKHPVVPVFLKDGDFSRVVWGGFVDIEEIRQWRSSRAKPVKLDITEFSVSPGELPIWRKVPEGHVVQGAIIEGRAYCVVEDGMPRVVPVPRQ